MARWRLCTVNNSHKQKEDDWHKDDCIQPTTNTKKRRQLAKRCMCTVDNSHNQRDVDWHNEACFQPTTHTNKKKTTSSMMLTQTKRRRFAKWRFDFTLLTVLKTTCTMTFVHSPRLWQTKRRQLAQIRLFTANNSHKQKEDDWHKDDCIQTTSTM